jgi:hypothetical protein
LASRLTAAFDGGSFLDERERMVFCAVSGLLDLVLDLVKGWTSDGGAGEDSSGVGSDLDFLGWGISDSKEVRVEPNVEAVVGALFLSARVSYALLQPSLLRTGRLLLPALGQINLVTRTQFLVLSIHTEHIIVFPLFESTLVPIALTLQILALELGRFPSE